MKKETLPEPLESGIQRTVNRNLLKYAAGRLITCPDCGNVMDWRRTVIAHAEVSRDGSETQLVHLVTLCSRCFDKRLPIIEEGIEKAVAKGVSVTRDFVDGRHYA